MPLFQASGESGGAKAQPKWKRRRNRKKKYGEKDDDDSVLPLTRLCLLSLADNMKDVWAKDYADNYLDQYSFRHIMGPFNLLPGDLVEELTSLLCSRKQLSRAALHLLLVPQLRTLSLEKCPGLATSALCGHITARCQGLWSLDLSGAQQLPAKVLSETLGSLPALRSLSLAGTRCDGCVIRAIVNHCHLLRHLDISCCHFLSPAALLPLGGRAYFSSSASLSTSKSSISHSCPSHLSPPPLSSLLALDIGFGEEEGDPVAAAAFLLLSLPCLERVALEGLAQAFRLIENREFDQTDAFTDRQGVPRLREVWRQRQDMDRWSEKREGEDDKDDREEGEILWEGSGSESEEDSSRNAGLYCFQGQSKVKSRRRVSSQSGADHLILQLKDVKPVSLDSLGSLGLLCPDIHSISVDTDDKEVRRSSKESVLAAGLQMWSGQLRSLSLHHPGPLLDLLPALQISGPSLVSLTLEGVKSSPRFFLLEVIRACPRLRDLLVFAECPNEPLEEEDGEDLPRLPHLSTLTLQFSEEPKQIQPLIMLGSPLSKVLTNLLLGSPLLEKLSLVSLPCPLNLTLRNALDQLDSELQLHTGSVPLTPMPFGRLQYVNLRWTDVDMTTLRSLMQRSRRLKFIDVSHCWQIGHINYLQYGIDSRVQLVWSY
ncbi:uncharacterized protein si:ch211-214j8.12 [Cheilinus undulatus]|uniref:uncharacterized protein si:ch211-214j8.12 n=1 Tax=Cheilinus undulatus TaxID=241271 RepID=UPI001BD616C5|nr:uncharacterized protein si:ch211-214j8.12 [Cheilinus undulatus]